MNRGEIFYAELLCSAGDLLLLSFLSECALAFHCYNRTFYGCQRQPNFVRTMSTALRQFLCLKDSPFCPLCAVMHMLDLDLNYCHCLDH